MICARHVRLWAGLLLVPALIGLTSSSEDLTPRWIGDRLLVTAPKLHFLTGKSLERLRNGAAVPFDVQLSVSAGKGNPALQRALERFVVSYDLWEERFKVVQLRSSRASGTHLTAAAAEAWCLENISIPSSSIPPDKGLWVKIEIRSAESKPALAVQEEGGISLATLIDAFSRPARGAQDYRALETGPFSMADLRR